MARKKDAVTTTMTQEQLHQHITPIMQKYKFSYHPDENEWWGPGAFAKPVIVTNVIGNVCYLEGCVRARGNANSQVSQMSRVMGIFAKMSESDFSVASQLWNGFAPAENALGAKVYKEVLAAIR